MTQTTISKTVNDHTFLTPPFLHQSAIPDVPATSEEELREMSNRAQQTKREIARERKRNKKEQRGSPVRSRQEERLRKKLGEQEGRIILAAPDLPLRIYHMQGKVREI